MVMISLLSLPLDLPPDAPAREGGLTTFVDQLPEYLGRCQSFEGGLSGSPQMTEAHGGYLDLPSLLSWMSSRQHAPEGGYSGRTNKLVDGCYSHWVGAAWTFIEAALRQPPEAGALTPGSVDEGLYSKEGLIRYVLSCCQADSGEGGLRDKPNTGPDGYHTCYALAGFSYAQHSSTFDDAAQSSSANGLAAPFGWVPTSRPADQGNERSTEPAYDIEDTLQPLHPIYVIPWHAVEQTRAFYSAKVGF
ncbi:MAG: CAAX farnesyltransferase (FTase) subunit beta [Ramalina farinacea]|uniref:CAAX farnesyltransferase (FTase) subunit beta n=1 Tax=Ramalina farinacea TaxID=258253 RepID=A0AA43QUE4_9LECA|nr:CAAX farnesyltransferase (FTase) subunit beta [Ramalina farinacea]